MCLFVLVFLCRLARASQTYLFPIHLTDQLLPSAVFYATVGPLLFFMVVHRLVVIPYTQAQKEQSVPVLITLSASHFAKMWQYRSIMSGLPPRFGKQTRVSKLKQSNVDLWIRGAAKPFSTAVSKNQYQFVSTIFRIVRLFTLLPESLYLEELKCLSKLTSKQPDSFDKNSHLTAQKTEVGLPLPRSGGFEELHFPLQKGCHVARQFVMWLMVGCLPCPPVRHFL